FLLRKINLNDEPDLPPGQLFTPRPHQVIVLDDPPNAWAPSIAVAVKFKTVDQAFRFICREQDRVEQTIDRGIILSAAREAKKKMDRDDESAIIDRMKVALGESEWERYSKKYKINPTLVRIEKITSNVAKSDQDCRKNILNLPGSKSEAYFLTPK